MNQPNWIISPGFGVNIFKKNPLSCHHLVTYIKPQGIKPKNSSRVRGFFPAFERVFQAILPAAFQGDFETFHLGVTKVKLSRKMTTVNLLGWINPGRT